MARLVFQQPETDFDVVTRIQADLACIQNFKTGSFNRLIADVPFTNLAHGFADKYFHRSADGVLIDHVTRVYRALLIMAPIIQREPLSVRFDWQAGHLLSHFRVYTKEAIGRFHFSVRLVHRVYDPDRLVRNLHDLGVHDQLLIDELLQLYDRFNMSSQLLQHRLATLLFDPLLLHGRKEGFELRHGRVLYRLEKYRFPGSVDLRNEAVQVLQYSIRSEQRVGGGRRLVILLNDEYLTSIKARYKGVLNSAIKPASKVRMLYRVSYDFLMVALWAKNAGPQILELSLWLAKKLSSLAGTFVPAHEVAKRLYGCWVKKRNGRLLLKAPNFFLAPERIDQDAYMQFFSPFRGGDYGR